MERADALTWTEGKRIQRKLYKILLAAQNEHSGGSWYLELLLLLKTRDKVDSCVVKG